MRTSSARAALLLLGALALASCKTPVDRTGQSTRGFYVPGFEVLWELSAREMSNHGYTVDQEASCRESRTMVSRWKVSLQPFAFKGWREQATLYFHPVEGKESYWTVEANVLRQANQNEKEPGSALKATWD